MNLPDLFKFMKAEQGKVMIVGEDGEVKGVFLTFDEYRKLTGSSLNQSTSAGLDPEKINREILNAQLTDNLDVENKNLEVVTNPAPNTQPVSMPTPIQSILSRRAKDLFATNPYGRQEPPEYDMRQEVIDPTFGLPTTPPVLQPLVETEGDEEIKPNFDDI